MMADDVLYISDLKASLLSMLTLSEKGFAITFYVCIVLHQGELYAAGTLRNGVLELDNQESKACTVKPAANAIMQCYY